MKYELLQSVVLARDIVLTLSVDDVRPIEERDVIAVGPLDEAR